MKHKFVRIALVVLEALSALTTIAGGIALIVGVIKFPLAQLQGTPFSGYTVPGLILAVIVGGSSLAAVATAFVHQEWAVLLSAAAGLILAGWIVGEVILLGPFAVLWQIPFFVQGIAIFGLAAYLWLTEYRSPHLQTRHVSHA